MQFAGRLPFSISQFQEDINFRLLRSFLCLELSLSRTNSLVPCKSEIETFQCMKNVIRCVKSVKCTEILTILGILISFNRILLAVLGQLLPRKIALHPWKLLPAWLPPPPRSQIIALEGNCAFPGHFPPGIVASTPGQFSLNIIAHRTLFRNKNYPTRKFSPKIIALYQENFPKLVLRPHRHWT